VTEPATRLRAPTTTDRYGTAVLDWDNATATQIVIRGFAPGMQAENNANGREGVTSVAGVYLYPGADILATDRLIVRGRTYRVNGEPADWSHPQSRGGGVLVNVERVDG